MKNLAQLSHAELYQLQSDKQLIRAFMVFKKGTTEFWQTILIHESEFCDELLNKKISFYKWLGYQVKDIDGTKL